MKRWLLGALDLVLSLLLLVVLSPLWPFAYAEWLREQREEQTWQERPIFRRTRDMRCRK